MQSCNSYEKTGGDKVAVGAIVGRAEVCSVFGGGGWQLRAPQGGSRPSAQSIQSAHPTIQRTENIANYMMLKFSVFCAPGNMCPVQLS